jgi:ribonucleotide reductase beta subunit family protein with ferritin-like domain
MEKGIMDISLVEKDKTIKEFTKQQLQIFWLPDEPKVEKDIQDVLVNMTASEKHGVITVLKLFSLYEIKAGKDYWIHRFAEMFPNDIEYQEMASAFSFFEICVHLQFYKKLNELLHINTDEFYNSYVDDEVLKSRMEYIDSIVSSKDDLYSLGAFSLVEGVILYSSFAYLKHFQSKGKNKLLNVVRGVNFSVRDENLHSMAGAYAFKKKLQESNLSEEEFDKLKSALYTSAEKLKEHEYRIIDMIFEMGSIDSITGTQMKHFVDSRVNLCLKELGLKAILKVDYNPIAEWFYDGINGFQYNDFFSGIGNQYSRDWSESEFVWEIK